MTNSSYIDFILEKERSRKDTGNIYCTGITDEEFITFITEYLLGEDWYVVDPLGHNQINQIALEEILNKYSKKFRKELSNYKRGVNNGYTIRKFRNITKKY